MKIYDISMPLYNGVPGWPGDTPYTFGLAWTKEETGSVNVGKLSLSTHTGTHVDAPFHFRDEGKKLNDLPLELYAGKCQVMDVSHMTSITANSIKEKVPKGTKRLLLKTMAWRDRSVFPETIPHIEREAATVLASLGVELIGVDVPSVDPLDSKDLLAHHSLLAHNIHILEGLVLDSIEEGNYELIALPLALQGSDASPVRAVLRTL
ncbi:arylformamidase [Fictibacillus iocasae]|uniref:Kynurenine formamidase n=1 Tax=Fictibacillus iocasae TaxID=2715437 RepID=A0ABW2NT10_9BACL